MSSRDILFKQVYPQYFGGYTETPESKHPLFAAMRAAVEKVKKKRCIKAPDKTE